jgi:hypothetical protein
MAAEPLVVFTHVPKTSGTSFRKSLIEPNLAPEEIFRYGGVRDFALRCRPRHRFVWGHMPLGAHHATRRRVRYMTFLRDPIDRAVSYYYFVRDSDPRAYRHPEREAADALSLTEFYARRRYQNWQTRFLAGLQYHQLYPRLDSPRFDRATLRRALANLEGRYACFGLQERFPESLDLIQESFGWERREAAEREKKTGTRPRLEELDAETVAALRRHNALDCRLYEAACERFEAQLTARAVAA